MNENEFLLNDRIQKIQSINEQFNLEENAYVSFSGGKDSRVVSELIDIALPQNRIPRVFINTGIEYNLIVQYIRTERERDDRLVIINPTRNISAVLKEYGYPFKSKEHSHYLNVFQNSGYGKSVQKYLNRKDTRFQCPDLLKYQFTENYKTKISDKCCYKLKKEPAKKWAKENCKPIVITGMRSDEGGLRASLKGCAIFNEGKLMKFHPLQPVSEEFINWIVEKYSIRLCDLYYPPYNFERTGCKGCPFSLRLQEQLDVMANYLPSEEKQCESIWKPIYMEYRKLGYRLRDSIQTELFL